MVLFKDFVPKQTAQARLFSKAQYEALEAAVTRANDWIAASEVEVINVETVALPNMHVEEGPTDPELRTSGEFATYWYQSCEYGIAESDSSN